MRSFHSHGLLSKLLKWTHTLGIFSAKQYARNLIKTEDQKRVYWTTTKLLHGNEDPAATSPPGARRGRGGE